MQISTAAQQAKIILVSSTTFSQVYRCFNIDGLSLFMMRELKYIDWWHRVLWALSFLPYLSSQKTGIQWGWIDLMF